MDPATPFETYIFDRRTTNQVSINLLVEGKKESRIYI